MLTHLLSRLNHSRLWRRSVRIGSDRLRANSLDRWVYLWRWRLRGSRSAEARFLTGQLRPGMHVVDIGANLGAYSTLFARAVGPRGRVTAFEPDPRLFQALQENVRANGLAQIQPHRLALGARAGVARLNAHPLNSGDNRIARGPATGAVEVAMTTLDDFLQGAPVDLVKCDVQGMEPEVLRGMRGTLAANRGLRLYFEFWPYGLAQIGSSSAELLALLSEQGFSSELHPRHLSAEQLDLAALARRPGWFADLYAWRP
jgi:FkbM family methyltransferase